MHFAAEYAAAAEAVVKYAASHDATLPLLRTMHAATPHDRLPSLVFADHLEEIGKPAHAEVIRRAAALHEAVEKRGYRTHRFSDRYGADAPPASPDSAVSHAMLHHGIAKPSISVWWEMPDPSDPERKCQMVSHTANFEPSEVRRFVEQLKAEGGDTSDAEHAMNDGLAKYAAIHYRSADQPSRSEYVKAARERQLASLTPELRRTAIAKEKRLAAARNAAMKARRLSMSPAEFAAKIREYVAKRGPKSVSQLTGRLGVTSGHVRAAIDADGGSSLRVEERSGRPDGGGRRGQYVALAGEERGATPQPSPSQPQPTPLPIPGEAKSKYAAYRAPQGGVTVRGLFYQGGSLIPDLQKFAAGQPASKRQQIVERLRKRLRPAKYARSEAAVSPHEAFHKAIAASPSDHLPSLVYADWLDENSHPAAAKLIREAREQAEQTGGRVVYVHHSPLDDEWGNLVRPTGKLHVTEWPTEGGSTLALGHTHVTPDERRMTVRHLLTLPTEAVHAHLTGLAAEGVYGADHYKRQMEREYPHLRESAAAG